MAALLQYTPLQFKEINDRTYLAEEVGWGDLPAEWEHPSGPGHT